MYILTEKRSSSGPVLIGVGLYSENYIDIKWCCLWP